MTFYKQVFEEYNTGESVFICESSQTFQKAWNSEFRLQILEHSKLYLESTNNMSLYRKDILDHNIFKGCCLFKTTNRNLRLDFLKFCVDNNLDLI